MIEVLKIKNDLLSIDLPNMKPSLEFDKKYGTKLYQFYNFPFGFSADEVSKISYLTDCRYNYYNDSREYYSNIWNVLVTGLTNDNINIVGINDLSHDVRVQILAGMYSGFNIPDIIHFAVNEIYAYDNPYSSLLITDLNNKFGNDFGHVVELDVRWVISKYSYEHITRVVSPTNVY